MFSAEALANRLPCGFRASGIAARELAETVFGGAMEATLPGGVALISIALLQPILRVQLEGGRKRDFAAAGLALEFGFQVGRNTPATDLGLHALRCSASSRQLTVFDAHLDVRIRQIDEPAKCSGVCGRSRPELHVAHELAGALQQAAWIRQRCAVIEPHVYV